MLNVVAIAGYRSLRNIVVPLRGLNLITGANGSGKSNFYRALRLLGDIAQDRVIPSIAQEGGLGSTLWAGPETIARSVVRGDHPLEGTVRTGPVSLRLGYSSTDFGYLIDLGLPSPVKFTQFTNDPEIKREQVWFGARPRPSTLWVDRWQATAKLKDEAGGWQLVDDDVQTYDSVVTRLSELFRLRDAIRRWRFYDHFRTDADAPSRKLQIATHTPVLNADGRDLPSAIQTIFERAEKESVDSAVDDAFPGSTIAIRSDGPHMLLDMKQPGLLRPLSTAELSDGTLRYLLWVAALLTMRPPELMVLNEPETSLHPDLLPALARLIGRAARQAQVIVVSHAPPLIAALTQQPGCHHVELVKEHGETVARLPETVDPEETLWKWPKR